MLIEGESNVLRGFSLRVVLILPKPQILLMMSHKDDDKFLFLLLLLILRIDTNFAIVKKINS